MKSWVLVAFLLMCRSLSSAQSPFLRVTLSPVKRVIVGQPVHVTVDVMVPNYFTGSPDFPQFELNNAIVVLPEERPEHINATVDGKFFAGIRRSYIVYPEQPGQFTLPPAEIRVPYAAVPPNSTEAKLALPPRSFEAAIPAAARNLDYFLPTTQLRISEKLSTSLKDLRVGDSFERTIMITTLRMQAMFIPPVALEVPDGVRIYPKNPEIVDQAGEHGELLQGRRTERATYLIEKQGRYTLPEVQIQWWDLSSGRLRKSILPAITIKAAANPNYVAELPPEAEPSPLSTGHPNFWKRYKRSIYLLLVAVGISSIMAWSLLRWAPPLLRWWRRYRDEARNSEAAAFRRLAHACRTNHATDAYRYLLQWLAHSFHGYSLDDFTAEANDSELNRQVLNLTESLYACNRAAAWSGRRLLQALKRHQELHAKRPGTTSHLPPLNP